MANEEHERILRKGVKSWNEWRKTNLDISPDLVEVNLSHANLNGANLYEANLRGAKLIGANLSHTDSRIANLSHADLRGANLNEANLIRANLNGANLRMADLGHASLLEADLRGANLLEASLVDAHLLQADLRKANLSYANFYSADLRRTDLRKTDLSNASLNGANLRTADLRGADLSYARLMESDFTEASLRAADFTLALLWNTNFTDVDLRGIINLETVVQSGPSTIGIDTIYKSKGDIPHKFLRDAGVPDNFITYMSSLVGKAFEYHSCFISYTETDDDISKRLYDDLQAAGLRVWRWREDAIWGAPIEKNIDQAVHDYDKLIVICSQQSLKALPVIDEIKRALGKEHDLMTAGQEPEVLFPISIDDYIFDEWEHYIKPKVMDKTVGDFRNWQDNSTYQVAFKRLITALQRGEDHDESETI